MKRTKDKSRFPLTMIAFYVAFLNSVASLMAPLANWLTDQLDK